MKIRVIVTLFLCIGAPLLAQYSAPPQPVPTPTPAPSTTYSPQSAAAPSFSPGQLDQLLGPVALYPDPLLGTILPASTHPDQIAAAASLGSGNADPSQIDQQPWDDSVKALAHYPEVLAWMAQNTQWTDELGSAVAVQEPDVLDAVQRLRANARASGLLVNTPQQQVIVQNNVISIVPAQPGMVYVPSYDPQYVVTSTPPGTQVALQFGVGYALSSWAVYGLDWSGRSVWIDSTHHEGRGDWRRFESERHESWRPTPNVAHWQQPREREQWSERSRIVQPAPARQRFGEWNNRTQTPGLTPTGRVEPSMQRTYPSAAPTNEGFRPRTENRPAVQQPARPNGDARHRPPEVKETKKPNDDGRRDGDDRDRNQ